MTDPISFSDQAMEKRLKILEQRGEDFFKKELDPLWKTHTLEYQQSLFGNRLLKPLPLSVGSSKEDARINPLFLPFIGPLLEEFSRLLPIKENSQDNGIVGVANASGCGKTKLAYSLALEKGRLVFLIRLYYKLISQAVRRIEKFSQLVYEKCNNPIQVARICLNALRLMVLVHVDWGLHVVQLLQKKGFSDSKQREGCLRALQNGFGETVACLLLDHFLDETFLQTHEELVAEYKSMILRELEGKNVVFFFDEIASLQGICPGIFYHWSEYKMTKESGPQERIEVKKNKEMEGEKVGEQQADLFYGIRIIMEEFIASHPKIPQVMADTTFSLWAVIDISKKSPLRRRVAHFCRTQSITVKQMVDFLRLYFTFSKSDCKSLQQNLKKFEGRPIFFFNDFLSKFLELLPRHQGNIEDMIENSAGSAFALSVQSFSDRLQSHIHNNTNPEPKQIHTISGLLDQIYFALRMDEGRLTITNTACRDLIEKGFLCPDLKEDSKSEILIRITEEPFCEALKQVYDGIAFSRMSQFLFGRNIDAKQSEKGTIGEQILSFYFLSKKRSLLSDAIAFLLPENFGKPLAKPWEFDLEYGMSKFIDSKHFLEPCFSDSKINTKALLHRVPQVAGPDIVFILRNKDSPEELAILLLQCKIQEEVDLFHAVSSIDPGRIFFFLPSFLLLTAALFRASLHPK
jgi:hypothetical protein